MQLSPRVPICRSVCWTDEGRSGNVSAMTRDEAEALAREVHDTTGHEARAEFEDDDFGFAVVVPIAQPHSGAVREEFRLNDEVDWQSLRDRIASA